MMEPSILSVGSAHISGFGEPNCGRLSNGGSQFGASRCVQTFLSMPKSAIYAVFRICRPLRSCGPRLRRTVLARKSGATAVCVRRRGLCVWLAGHACWRTGCPRGCVQGRGLYERFAVSNRCGMCVVSRRTRHPAKRAPLRFGRTEVRRYRPSPCGAHRETGTALPAGSPGGGTGARFGDRAG